MNFNTMYIDSENPSYIYYKPNYFNTTNIKDWLDSMSDFKSGEIYGHPIDRQQKWYQKDDLYFCKKWDQSHERWKSHKYCDKLTEIQNDLQIHLNKLCTDIKIKIPNINSCLINLYKDGNDVISRHSDNLDSFGPFPTIVILSVGETRTIHFEVKEQYLKSNPRLNFYNKQFQLEDGSIFIMSGSTQQYFYHSIQKEDTTKPRYSLTFREYIA